jgi:hypothetical protein
MERKEVAGLERTGHGSFLLTTIFNSHSKPLA